jgi:hypothetical protein
MSGSQPVRQVQSRSAEISSSDSSALKVPEKQAAPSLPAFARSGNLDIIVRLIGEDGPSFVVAGEAAYLSLEPEAGPLAVAAAFASGAAASPGAFAVES